MDREINIAINICTYHRWEYVNTTIELFQNSLFWNEDNKKYYNHLHLFIVDNGAGKKNINDDKIHIFQNRNTGGSGGFQRGIEEIRKASIPFTHVVFMDDDVLFEISSFYILYNFLITVSPEYYGFPVAGRMLCMDNPDIQYTAAEIWNGGEIQHVEYMRKLCPKTYHLGTITYDSKADYGGWWLCCYPMSFVKENDIIPFFLHCDDVEYGLRCGKPPILIEGFHVWHETFDKRFTPLIQYYDTRNPLFVNELHGLNDDPHEMLQKWKEKVTYFHQQSEWLYEYFTIRGMRDFLRGITWLTRIDSARYHKALQREKACRIKNAIYWRIVEWLFHRKYGK